MNKLVLGGAAVGCVLLAMLYVGFQVGKQNAIDNVFELCYNGALIIHDERVVACFPMAPVSDEEKKELDKSLGA